MSSLNNFAIEQVDFEAQNEKKGAEYNNWIQYRVRKCKCKIRFGWCWKKKCWSEWENKKTQMSSADWNYYITVLNRINQKLLTVQ